MESFKRKENAIKVSLQLMMCNQGKRFFISHIRFHFDQLSTQPSPVLVFAVPRL
jgi:hypothetical protein